MENEKIAVVGLGIIAPKALNKEEFWNNVKTKRNCIIEVPVDRWNPALYYDPNPKAKDKTYSKIGGFIENFKFDSIKYKIPPSSASQIARLQQMTIEAVRMALEDAGYDHAKNDPRRTGVIIANAMGAMRKELTDLRVYKFLNEDMMLKTSVISSLKESEREKLIAEYEELIDKHILNITEDTMPGELSNVTSGRIANIFNFNGPNLTTDAACASSFAALDYAIMALRSGKIDVAISGGADEMMSPAAYVKFCKIGALSPDGSWAFDARANGFVMAEAVGIYVLKRLSDAIRDGNKIYALINAVGASSDGKGKGITAPNPKGQLMAIENAFSELDYGPGEVDFVECHGTATKVGDAAEAQVLKEFFGPYLSGKKLKVTSVKSQIGHSKAAAGAVSLIKTALALKERILPPSANFSTPNPNIDFNVVEVITEPLEYRKNGIRRANVSSFGFGGTNFHVAMEEYTGQSHSINAKKSAHGNQPHAKEEVKMVNNENTLSENPKTPYSALQGETLTLTAATAEELSRKLDELSSKAGRLGERYPLANFSVPMNMLKQKTYGIAIVAKSPADLVEKIAMVKKSYSEKIFEDNPLSFKLKGVYAFKNRQNYGGKIGFLFPGQGSQYVDMMRDLAAKYQVVQDTFDEADRILEKMINVKLTDTLWSRPGESKQELEKREAAIKQTQMTQPAVMTADMAMFRLLREFGIKPDMAIGHSLGEYAAATAAGIFTLENGLRAVTSRAKEMSNIKVADPGKMASVAWPVEKVEEQLKKINGYVIAANKNCPIQTVIAGEGRAVDEAVKLFQSLGIQAQEIPVSHAFHSAIIEPAIGPYREFLQRIPIKSWDMPILSNVTADFFPKDTQGIYDLLVKQMVSPVEFISQIRRMYDEGVRIFIECGPKRVLSAFVTTTLEDKKDIFILSSNHPKRGGIFEYNDMLANMMTVDFKLNWSGKIPEKGNALYNPYYLNWATQFCGEVESQTKTAIPTATYENTLPADIGEFARNYGFNFNPIAVSGIAGGTPGTWGNLFREKNLDEILAGKNMIEPVPHEWRHKQIDKNILRVIKSETGNHRIEPIDSIEESIKLSARKGALDIEKEFGIPHNMAKAMNDTFQMAIGAGILALKDAGLPLVHYYKKTTTGGWLPEKWALPEPLASETGVVFASAFPTMESIIREVTDYFMDKYSGLSDDKLWDVYDSIVEKLHSEEDKREIRKWMKENLGHFHSPTKKERYSFSQNFLLKVIPIADSQFAQWVGAKGPTIHISAACASTTQAVNIAESWIRSGKCKRVVVISADDITSEFLQQWTMPGFLASGTATTKEKVEEAALPFDNRRNGLIVGSASAALVIEDETLVRERGMKPLARMLLTEVANSAYHVTRLDTNHVSQVMDNFISKVEKIYGLKRSEIAPKTLFMSHETYTPKRGGSAAAEVMALRKAFGDDANKIIVSNVKGFTGHTMGAALEDAIAIRALNTGIVPPIANYKEPDPELGGINLSKGGKYDFKYSIRFAAGFGSHMAMSFAERVFMEGEQRTDENMYFSWLKSLCGYEKPETEVVYNTLRIKDMGPIKIKAPETPAIKNEKEKPSENRTVAAENTPKAEKKESVTVAPAALSEDSVKERILNMICEKTGYPKDMLELDLDMEADLGIDTVKQAELFAAIREYFEIPKQENLSLKDYPTIRHCVKFVLENKQATAPASAALPAQPTASSKPEIKTEPKPAARTEDSSLSEDSVKERILNMICEKAGYPKDMLELDLDMEADLGIDTVKQAELFAAIRESFEIPKQENLSLKDYPTIRHCIKFVLENKQPVAQPVKEQHKHEHYSDPLPEATKPMSSATAINESEVTEKILSMICEKTGYPKDMLELDLDMEADLGIDTVKQAELFAAIREYFEIPKQENLSLKDYPTIRHCVKFVLENKQATAPASAALPAQPTASSKPEIKTEPKPAARTEDSSLSEDFVKERILNMICEKTGYPKDMLELDLDMEADLGIDTVKQAELFAAIRESFEIPKQENLSLKDYPTIRHCIKFVLENKQPVAQPVKEQHKHEHYSDPLPEATKPMSSATAINESEVTEKILSMICEKTGYPKDMLELDLDMEADLGIDTVKQAELFAAIREYFEIPKQENLSLKDYPTIRHCVKFVLENKQATAPTHPQKTSSSSKENSFKASHYTQEKPAKAAPESSVAVAEPEVNLDEIIAGITNNHPPRHFRYTPVITEMPVKEEIIKKFDTARPVLIIGENMELIKACRKELSKLELNSVLLTSQKTKLSDTYLTDFNSQEEVENALKEISLKYPDLQGLIYLMGCVDRPFTNSIEPMKDMKYYAMPLFLAVKYFHQTLNNPSQDCSSFVSVVTTLDGHFGYMEKSSYDPVYASIFGISLCMRKELDRAAVKLIDFEKDASVSLIAKKTFYEIQYSDLRHAVCYHSNKRHAMIAIPAGINKSKEKYGLKGKKVILTGAGRGLGALFAKILAYRWQPELVIMDIIEQVEGAESLVSMSAPELENYKKTEFLSQLKQKLGKVTPAILEKEFTKLKDAAGLIKTIKQLKALGSKVSYYRCDLNNTPQFEEVMAAIKESPRADGLVHFAGLERSKLIADKTPEEFNLIFQTKAQSAINLWKAGIVKDNGFWVMISSIAGKFGNLGQSDYAAASDYISKFAINLHNKQQRAFSIDMTGIANIGMGARPGVEAFLKSQNMEFLYPEEVMNGLADEIAYGVLPELIYSGDLGKLDWDKQLQYEPSYGEKREIENTGLHFVAKGEKTDGQDSFSCTKELSLKNDPYLKDHSINSTPVFPGVMGLETFAETVNVFCGIKPLSLKNISFQLPVKLLKNNPVEIRAKAQGKDILEMSIESDFINSKGIKMGETRIHFKAQYDPSLTPGEKPELPKIKSKYKTEKETIYKTYFHGPSFQVLDGIISADDKNVLAVFKKPSAPLLGERDMNYIFHPMVIEAVFQTCGWRDLYIENKMTLPDRIGEVFIADSNPDPEKLYTWAVFKGINDYGKSVYDGFAFDERGKIIVSLKDYMMIPVKI